MENSDLRIYGKDNVVLENDKKINLVKSDLFRAYEEVDKKIEVVHYFYFKDRVVREVISKDNKINNKKIGNLDLV